MSAGGHTAIVYSMSRVAAAGYEFPAAIRFSSGDCSRLSSSRALN
jgi:hypothetical protein